MAALLPQGDHVVERAGDVGLDGDIDIDDLVDGAAVDIDMDLAAVGREGVEAAGDAVIEARADAQDEVRLVHRPIGFIGAMHPQHAQPLVGRCGEGAQAHQGRGDGRAGERGEFAQQGAGLRAAIDDTAAGVEDGALGRGQHFDGCIDARRVRLDLRAVAGMLDRFGTFIGGGRDLDIFGNVDDDRAGATRRGDVERLMNDAGQLAGVFHQIIMLGAVARDADRIRFLERVGADQLRGHLPRDDDHGDRIHQRVGDAGDGIGRARAGGDQHDAGLAGRTGIALRHVGRALFMADQHMLDRGMIVERVINGQHRAAGIAEHDLDTEIDQAFNQYVRAALFGHDKSFSCDASPVLCDSGFAIARWQPLMDIK